MQVLVAQSCPTLCNLMDCSQPGSSAHGILQARILELIVISFSRGPSRPRDWTWVSSVTGRFNTLPKLYITASQIVHFYNIPTINSWLLLSPIWLFYFFPLASNVMATRNQSLDILSLLSTFVSDLVQTNSMDDICILTTLTFTFQPNFFSKV